MVPVRPVRLAFRQLHSHNSWGDCVSDIGPNPVHLQSEPPPRPKDLHRAAGPNQRAGAAAMRMAVQDPQPDERGRSVPLNPPDRQQLGHAHLHPSVPPSGLRTGGTDHFRVVGFLEHPDTAVHA